MRFYKNHGKISVNEGLPTESAWIERYALTGTPSGTLYITTIKLPSYVWEYNVYNDKDMWHYRVIRHCSGRGFSLITMPCHEKDKQSQKNPPLS